MSEVSEMSEVEKVSEVSEVEKLLQDYKDGKQIYLGFPEDIERGLMVAVYAYETEKGGIKLENGRFEYKPGVLERLPRYRGASEK